VLQHAPRPNRESRSFRVVLSVDLALSAEQEKSTLSALQWRLVSPGKSARMNSLSGSLMDFTAPLDPFRFGFVSRFSVKRRSSKLSKSLCHLGF
jgi:hypothetical protein